MDTVFLKEWWIIGIIIPLVLFDQVMKVIAMWKSARNNHLAWFICLAVFNTIGILPIVYLVLDRQKKKESRTF